MIGESEHFHFAGRKSTDFGIYNVSVTNGLHEELVVASKSIEEVYIPGREEPYFIDVNEEPKTIQLRFSFLEKWNDKLIDETIRWLNVSTYSPLYFEGDIDRVFYVIPIDGIQKMHNGLKDGYLELNMRCNSSKSYSHEIMTPEHDTVKLAEKQGLEFPVIKIGNKGHFSFYPKIWIEKIADGDILIYNKTNANQEFKFENIEIGEKLFVDCQKEIVETSLERTYRYDDFNDSYLKIVYGENILTVSNNMKIRFAFRYKFS